VNSGGPLACAVAAGFLKKTRTLLKIAERPDAANFSNVDPRSRHFDERCEPVKAS